jgi:zinc transporter ZupT
MQWMADLGQQNPVVLVLLLASLTALATGLGALPFLFIKSLSPRIVGNSNAIAAGLMLGATFGLMAEGTEFGALQTVIGAQLGVLFILLSSRLIGEDVEFGSLRGAGARRVLIVLMVMTFHSVAEGIAVGASYAGGISLATFVTIAIAVHNIPEGLAISAVLRPQGTSVFACGLWSVFSSLPQPLMAVPAFLFVDRFRPTLPYAMGFAAGAMLLMVLQELLPEAYEEGSRTEVGLLVSLTLFAMILFQHFI